MEHGVAGEECPAGFVQKDDVAGGVAEGMDDAQAARLHEVAVDEALVGSERAPVQFGQTVEEPSGGAGTPGAGHPAVLQPGAFGLVDEERCPGQLP